MTLGEGNMKTDRSLGSLWKLRVQQRSTSTLNQIVEKDMDEHPNGRDKQGKV